MIKDFFINYIKEVISITTPFLGWILNTRFQKKVRIVWSVRHAFTFLIQEPLLGADQQVIFATQTVHTASISVTNSGKITATNVEIVFNWRPQYINVWPIRSFEEKIAADKRFSIHLENLASGEPFGFELFSINRDLPEIIHVRSEQSVAKLVYMTPQIIPKPWLVQVVRYLSLIGFGATLYMLAILIQLIANSRPTHLGGW